MRIKLILILEVGDRVRVPYGISDEHGEFRGKKGIINGQSNTELHVAFDGGGSRIFSRGILVHEDAGKWPNLSDGISAGWH